MADYDGEVRLRMVLTADGVKQAAKELSRDLNSAVNTSGIDKLDSKFQKLADRMTKLQGKAADIVAEMEKLENSQQLTEEYKEQEKVINSLMEKISALEAKQERFLATGGKKKSTTFKTMEYDLEALRGQLKEAQEDMDGLVTRGYKYQKGSETPEYQKLVEQLAAVNDEMRVTQEQAEQLSGTFVEEEDRVTESTEETRGRLRSALDAVKSKVKEVYKELSKPHPKNGFLHKNNIGASIKQLAMWAIGIRSVFALLQKLKAAAKESLKVMASYDSTLNKKISDILTSLKQIKADIGTMIEPLVQTFAPIINNLLAKIRSLIQEMSKFFAALVGQDYISVATVKNVDYADSLDDVANSANKANKALGSYDKLNVISKDTSGGDAKSTMALTKDTVEYVKQALDPNSWTVKLGKKVREIFDWTLGKLKDIKKWLEKQEWVQSIIESLKEMMKDPETFLTLIGATLVVTKLVGMLTSAIGGLKLGLVLTIAIAGFKIGNKIFDSLPEGMKDTLADVVGEFVEAFGEDGFAGLLEQWCSNVVEFFDDFFSPIKNAWNKFKSWFKKQREDANEATEKAWKKFWGTITGTIAEVPKMFSEMWSDLKTSVKEKWKSTKAWFAGIGTEIKNIFKDIGTWFSNLFKGAWNGIKTAWSGTKKWFGDRAAGIKETFSGIGTWFSTKFTAAWTGIKNAWSGTKKWFSDRWTGIKEVFSSVGTWFTNKFTAAWTGIKNAWSSVKKWFSDKWTGIKEVFGNVGTWFSTKFTTAWTNIKNAWSGVKKFFTDKWTAIKEVFKNVGTWFKEKFKAGWEGIKEAFSNPKKFFSEKWQDMKDGFGNVKKWFSDKFDSAWTGIKEAFKKPKKVFTDIWNEIKSPFEGITTWFQVKFTNAWNKITEVFSITKAKKFFSNLWEKITETFKDVGTKVGEAVGGAFKKVINTVLETVETVLNTPIKAINSLLGVINQVPGINIGKLDTLSLPRLAQGAVIPANREFLAVLGDQKHGTNIEAPLDTIVEAMEKALGSTGGRQDININIDGKRVARIVWDETEKRYKQTGNNSLAFGM